MSAPSLIPANVSTGSQLWLRDVLERRRSEGRPVPPDRVQELVDVAKLRDQRDLARRDANRGDAGEHPSAARFAAEAAQLADDLDRQLRRAWKAFDRT